MTARKPSPDKAAQDAIEGRTPDQGPPAKSAPQQTPAAGPHADPELINPDATPGSGYMPPLEDHKDADADSPSG